jgi:hypothetical protein
MCRMGITCCPDKPCPSQPEGIKAGPGPMPSFTILADASALLSCSAQASPCQVDSLVGVSELQQNQARGPQCHVTRCCQESNARRIMIQQKQGGNQQRPQGPAPSTIYQRLQPDTD